MQVWTDLDAVVYHGAQSDREAMEAAEFSYLELELELDEDSDDAGAGRGKGGGKGKKSKGGGRGRAKKQHLTFSTAKFEVVIASYETCMIAKGKSFLKSVQWDMIVIDEAHKLKNHRQEDSPSPPSLPTYRYRYTYRSHRLNCTDCFKHIHIQCQTVDMSAHRVRVQKLSSVDRGE